jgi:hypothetical protein
VIEVGVVERETIKHLARRQTLRDAIDAIERVTQANNGERILIRKKDAVAAITHLSSNALVWGGIRAEEGKQP